MYYPVATDALTAERDFVTFGKYQGQISVPKFQFQSFSSKIVYERAPEDGQVEKSAF